MKPVILILFLFFSFYCFSQEIEIVKPTVKKTVKARSSYKTIIPKNEIVALEKNDLDVETSNTNSSKDKLIDKYEVIEDFIEGIAIVKKNEKYGFIDITKKEVIPIIYDYVYPFNENLSCVRKKGKYGYINKIGEIIIPIVFDDAWSFFNGRGKVKKYEKWFYINKEGECIEDCP